MLPAYIHYYHIHTDQRKQDLQLLEAAPPDEGGGGGGGSSRSLMPYAKDADDVDPDADDDDDSSSDVSCCRVWRCCLFGGTLAAAL